MGACKKGWSPSNLPIIMVKTETEADVNMLMTSELAPLFYLTAKTGSNQSCKMLVYKLCVAAELYRNNLFGGTAFSCYGSFWLAFGTFGMTSSGGILSAPTKFPHGMEMFLSLWGEDLPLLLPFSRFCERGKVRKFVIRASCLHCCNRAMHKSKQKQFGNLMIGFDLFNKSDDNLKVTWLCRHPDSHIFHSNPSHQHCTASPIFLPHVDILPPGCRREWPAPNHKGTFREWLAEVSLPTCSAC